MRFDSSRCLECGKPGKPVLPVGRTDFWFCSLEHYRNAYSKLMDKKYAFPKTVLEDSEWKKFRDEIVEEVLDRGLPLEDCPDLQRKADLFKDNWVEEQRRDMERARTELHNRIFAEYDHKKADEKEKQAEVDRKTKGESGARAFGGRGSDRAREASSHSR